MSNRNSRPTTPILGFPDVRAVPVYIYGLADPRTGEIRYVGKSDRPKLRLASHRSNSGARAVREWCAEVMADGLSPEVVELFAVLPGHDADPWERHFIAAHDGTRLLNARGARGDISRGLNVAAHHERLRARMRSRTEAA